MRRIRIPEASSNEFDSKTKICVTSIVVLACAWSAAFMINPNAAVRRVEEGIVVLDSFYKYPLMLRAMVLILIDWKPHRALYQTMSGTPLPSCIEGQRAYFSAFVREALDSSDWKHAVEKISNGWIQLIYEDASPTVHHDSLTRFGGVLYLTPEPLESSGTSFYTHKESGLTRYPTVEEVAVMPPEEQTRLLEYEKRDIWTEHEPSRIDQWCERVSVANVFNRLVLFDSQLFHKAQRGFGTTKFDGRMYQTFFFGKRDAGQRHGDLKGVDQNTHRNSLSSRGRRANKTRKK